MCVYCENEQSLVEKEFPYMGFGTFCYDQTWSIFIDRGHLRLADKEDCQCMDHGENIKINYCPMCGKKIE